MLNEIYEKYIEKGSPVKAYDLLKHITSYHRLQGSTGIWDAVEEVKEFIMDSGYDVKVYKIDSGVSKGYIVSPVSWDPVEAWLEIRDGDKIIAKYSLADHPTLLSAHSPGGEGCAEITVCRGDKCSGEAVLVHGYLYDLYFNVDARLIIYYDENRFDKAFPYTGLFLKPGDEKDRVVMNIPYSIASKIIDYRLIRGRKIKVCWKARVKYHDKGLPVLVACNGDEPGIVFISHICHPKPGAHDNASGSVANYIVLDILSNVDKKYRYSSCHVWVPEYTGTVFLYDKLPWKPLGVINLDMIGSHQHLTGSTLTLINPPRYIDTLVSPALWFSIHKIFDQNKAFNNIYTPKIKYSYSPYTMGSDHDVFVGWGYDAAMLNEWPSKYYHTDMDEIHTISSTNIVLTSVASALAGYIVANKIDKLELMKKTYSSMVKNWYIYQALKKNYSINYITRYLIKKPFIEKTPEKPFIETPLSSRTIYNVLGREKFLKEYRIIPGIHTYISTYAPLAEKIGLKEHLRHYKAELLIPWKRRKENKVKELWETIKSILKL